jgi:hypothetical protein
MATGLARSEIDIKSIDSYAFLAVLGKRVIHPGGRQSTEELFRLADIRPGQRALDVGCGVAWTMPRLRKAVPYLGYVLVAGVKPSVA